MTPVHTLIIGAGDRGNTHASYSKAFPDEMNIVAVAEPDPVKRAAFAKGYQLKIDRCFQSWEQALAVEKQADAVIICTQDQMHAAPAKKALKKGYHVLLEKPMGTTEKECRELAVAAEQSNKIFGICYVLRYTAHYQKMKEIIDSGLIGEVVTIEHLEAVNYAHMAHSYVRGSWARSETSSPMILAKSCHDTDLMRWLVGKRCKRIASFGALTHFKKENAPIGSTKRCIDGCEVEQDCPYSALKLYLDMDQSGWPVNTITNDLSRTGREKALKEGPFGRCVYHSDNNVVDHQVVAMEFEGQITASFTMSAFTQGSRRTRIMGTMGETTGDMDTITVTNFRNNNSETVWKENNNDERGHGGGDFGLLKQFLKAVRTNDTTLFEPSIEISLESHLIALAAEHSRLTNAVVEL
ncbi:MAG TPA: Gfo/Idh/MocA family oxidoreductase [Candidatus Marinimicrobia bacterium]|jgi:predicted dehydrogenase|nr:Gfo/Idh/MocA family oxidoreductase [Candidatus Neomarinimicrobiota bacterium]HIB60780.1 Gfo/Idh/MocA family oxidoreductase [Candidatus Neomarinimicrobiota bacterium]